MSRNNSASSLRKETSTPNSLVELSQTKDKEPGVVLTAPTPISTTPGVPSRNSSPATQPSSQTTGAKNRRVSSAQETRRAASPSPARSISSSSIARLATYTASQPSPAAAPTAASATTSSSTGNNHSTVVNTEQAQPLSPRPQRPINPNVPHWPTSPRLSLSRSPPPNNRSSSVTSPRRPLDSTLTLPPPSMAIRDRGSPGPGRSGDESNDGTSYFHHTTGRPPRPMASPAPLETVTESSLPSTPAIGMGERSIDARLLEAEQRRQESSSMSTRPSDSSIATSRATAPESESDTGNMSDRKPPSRAPSRTVSRRPTVSNTAAKTQDTSGDVRAEIETVTSIPQQINPPATVRLTKKASQETIRPAKKEKRKRQKRAPGPGTQTTKADIFEQRINDTLDDAESSDSEETFVYESNPADKQRPRHSRTSSVTSLSDPRRALDGNQGRSRRSMKFGTSHAFKSQPAYDDYTSDGVGGSNTVRLVGNPPGVRSHIGRGYTNPNLEDGGSAPVRHAHHKTSHQSLRTPHHITSSRASSRPGSPRAFGGKHAGNNGVFPPKTPREASQLSLYEGDVEGDPDERTPLFYLNRNGGTKSRPSSPISRRRDYGQRNWFTRIACCIFAVFAMTSLVACALGFVFLTTKPLQEVRLLNITDIIAAKQEMMFNLDVNALNPNILPVTISTMDVNIFIKSPYVKDKPKKDKDKPDDGHDDDGWWKTIQGNIGAKIARRQRVRRSLQTPHALDGIDEGNDPINDPVEDAETMLLGRIFTFDSPLVFEGSPFRQESTHALGEVRLSKPGNKTEVGGSERWERAMVHTFELTVRGFLRYQLPLSGRVRTATIQSTVTVHPNEDSADSFRESTGSELEFHAEPN
ncbi:hypothetical protein H072_8394 [Dactylellina haptotyla CBS 200.50]|uniref:Uncharacterized protein n=1 Tax=Dactylellina haptotyla (strain CBS 200.50) TaxID=1284197 RepID=S8A9W5_DACHA|nr:hypothetical protein H072_8394 [Dactylellina haptotyla CBS 200.50]